MDHFSLIWIPGLGGESALFDELTEASMCLFRQLIGNFYRGTVFTREAHRIGKIEGSRCE